MELVDERPGLNKGRHTSLDGSDDHGVTYPSGVGPYGTIIRLD
ncbi:hypothetical protein [Bradyrhizobium frederickii]|nr:hypothetical protein [Bradyrhizobium frederickii]